MSQVTRKRRSPDGGGKRFFRSRLTAPAIVLFCVLVTGVGLFFYSRRQERPTPLYEEIYSARTRLQEKIRQIDVSIYDALYQSGVREEEICFPDVEPRHQSGQVWDFTEIFVKSPDRKRAAGIDDALSGGLALLGGGIRFRNEWKRSGEILCHVYVGNFYTHRVVLGTERPGKSPHDHQARAAIIIDDMGYDLKTGLSFLDLPVPLTFSVLPCAPFTRRIAVEARTRDREVLLHLPMEPKRYPTVNPGPGALLLSMNDREILARLDRDLVDIPGVRGVNNHMGSSFTEDREKMRLVLGELKRKHLFYVDSKTSRHAVGVKLAREMGLPVAARNVFLDNDLTPAAITLQLRKLLNMARHSGTAIGIGHPHRETLMALKKYLSSPGRDVQIVPVSELLSEPAEGK